MDATLIGIRRRQAVHGCKGCKAWQPPDCQWAEREMMPHPEFRDGNVPARSGPLADHRFPALREPLREPAPGDEGMLPFPVAGFAVRGRCKPFGVAAERREAGDEVVRWHRERCGRSEEAHAAPKSDPDGGRMPSGLSGAGAAWWMIAVMGPQPRRGDEEAGAGTGASPDEGAALPPDPEYFMKEVS